MKYDRDAPPRAVLRCADGMGLHGRRHANPFYSVVFYSLCIGNQPPVTFENFNNSNSQCDEACQNVIDVVKGVVVNGSIPLRKGMKQSNTGYGGAHLVWLNSVALPTTRTTCNTTSTGRTHEEIAASLKKGLRCRITSTIQAFSSAEVSVELFCG